MNDSGTVVGWFQAREFNPQGLIFGFIRTPEGTYTRFGASIGQFVDTYPIAINSTGNIAGIWFDTSSTDYPYANCFVKIGGIETTFSPPNRGNGCNATAINSSGEIAGYFQDMQNVTHGFVRESGGAITVFDPPSSTATWATSINTSGQISGYYNVSAGPQQAFIRNSDGSFTTFAVPRAISLTFNAVFNPQTVAINDSGETAGVMVTNGGTAEGWIRSPQGTVSSFQTCGQTGIVALNTAGHATGFCGGVGSMFSYEGWNF